MIELHSHRWSLGWFHIKLLLMVLYLVCDHGAVSSRAISLGASAGLLGWLILYCLLALALAAAAFIPRTSLRIAFALILAAGSVVFQSYQWATGSPLAYDAFETMVASRGDAGDALSQHGADLLSAVGTALILFAAIAISPKKRSLPFGLGSLLPTGAAVALACLLYLRGGEGAWGLPPPFTPLAQSMIMAGVQLTADHSPRRKVAIKPGQALTDGDVVLVIDESVAANYLDINNKNGVRSGLADTYPGVSIANFGVAASVAGCSAGTNQTLRFGGTRANYRQAFKSMPSIWAYARQAGRRTVYLDGQRSGGELQNMMTPAERSEIDDFVQVDSTAVLLRDHELAKLLGDRLQNGIAELIIVNKVGAHFPVADKFPDTAALFRPLPVRGHSEGITDIASLPTTSGDQSDWRLYRNAYRNTVVWNTGGFFDRLLLRVAATSAVLIYTSDHGQDLHELGGLGGSTHCTAQPRPEEGAVPLAVIAGSGAKMNWRVHSSASFDRMSHFRIFPTLLALMGYASQDTGAFYGPTLMAGGQDPFTFTPNYNASLGRDPSWRPIVRAHLASPPVTDYVGVARGS